MNYNDAVNKLLDIDIKGCIDFFRKNNYPLEYAYALFLSDKPDEALSVLKNLDSVRADWLYKLISILKGRKEYPTYFQIRCFLEIDMELLIKAQKIEYVNIILKYIDFFQGINGESYKLAGRCLLKNGYPKESKYFFDKSLNDYYNDMELHYLYVEYFLHFGDKENAKKAIKNCLRINPEYFPAKNMQKILQAK